MSSLKIYYEDTYRFTDQGTIVDSGNDTKGSFIILDRTIFYPQGGGQPADQGYIQIGEVEISIVDVRNVDNEIRHYINHQSTQFVGSNALLYIDPTRRLLNAKLHSAGHLIANIVEQHYQSLKAIKGHHFLGECYVEFICSNTAQELDIELLHDSLLKAINAAYNTKTIYIDSNEIKKFCPNLTYTIPNGESVRLISIANWDYQPCGGTHINSLSELQGLYIIKQKLKANSLKLYYKIDS